MANYDPRVYHQVHTAAAVHAGMIGSNVPPRFQHSNNVSLPSNSQSGQQGGTTAQDMKKKAGPGWENTYRTAQHIAFPDTRAACGEKVGEFVEDLARAIGCPVEYIIVPLLPCIGGLLGTKTTMSVHRGWTEPVVLWTLVGASPGSRRSAVIRQLLSPILSLQKDWKDAAASGNESSSNSRRSCGFQGGDGGDDESGDQQQERSDGGSSPPRALYSGTRITLAALTEVLHRNDGHAFSLTENVENLHDMLGLLQPMAPPRLVSVIEDLYEGLPLVGVEDGQVTTILGSNFCHGGFASPEYMVTVMLKCPYWLSSRLLLSCPQADDMKGVFGEPDSDAQLPELGQIYSVLLEQHQERRKYSYGQEALKELSTFFEDEWSTVLNQLDQNGHEGIIGKSMGQIVRISGILKSFTNALVHISALLEESDPPEWDWIIDKDTVLNAIVMSKYFLEQKLAMTFMVKTGFFNSSSSSADNSDLNIGSFLESPTTLPQTAVPENSSQSQFSNNGQGNHFGQSNSAQSIAFPPRGLGDQGLNSHIPQVPGGQTDLRFELPKRNSAGEVDYSTLPHTMTTMEEDVSEMMQAVDFVHFSKTQFVAVHGRRIKRLLECFDDGHGVSATTAAQKSITPPVRIQGTNNRHPAWASALFFQKVAELGLGIAEQGRHPTNRKVCWRFKRKPVSQLSEKDYQLLQYLRVEMDKYSQFGSGPFNPTMMVNSGLISLSSNGSPSTSPANQQGATDDDSNSQGSSRNTLTPSIKTEIF